jgi:glutathione synthase/RimK-type ligase-like ATP-grasp enzyme
MFFQMIVPEFAPKARKNGLAVGLTTCNRRRMKSFCILTPAPDYEESCESDSDHFVALSGKSLSCRSWTDPGDLSTFDLILPLLAWGYQRAPDAWMAALDRWEAQRLPFANPISMLRWNTDKIYLFDLEAAGIAIVPSQFAAALDATCLDAAHADFGETLVIKPTISGGADGTYRLNCGDPLPADVTGRPMLIQPMMEAIVAEGEYSLFLFEGVFSHAILKHPDAGDFRVQRQFGGRDFQTQPPADALACAQDVLAVLPSLPLYARVDLVRGDHRAFVVMELEVIEPSLFLDHAPDGGQRFIESLMRKIK